MALYKTIVMSCDRYQFLWAPFSFFYKQNWPCHENANTVMISESVGGQLENVLIKPIASSSWSGRLLCEVEDTREEFILLLLEDYIFSRPVPHRLPTLCLDLVQRLSANKLTIHRPRAGLYNLLSVVDSLSLYKFDDHSDYQTTVQLGFWRTSWLRDILKLGEYNPWEFETTLNSRLKGSNNQVYLIATESDLHLHAVEKGVLQPEARDFCRRFLFS
jgi:hypothetical protein